MMFDPDDYPDSDEYERAFTEWLFNHAKPSSLRKAQNASTSFVPPHVVGGSPLEYREYTGNDLTPKQFAALIEHLLEVLEEDYQGRPTYWTEAQDWAHSNMVDAAEDAFADRTGR